MKGERAREGGLLPMLSPQRARDRAVRLEGFARQTARDQAAVQKRLEEVRKFLGLAPRVEEALEQLSRRIFEERVGLLQEKLTLALREVLDQPISLKAETGFSRSSVTIEFYMERGGEREDIMRGQGGSVANILSVGLRMFALATLDPKEHRPFLVLDEQDCWLQPDLVPRLVKIIHDASKALGFQVMLISHHDTAHFAAYADRIYRFAQVGDECQVRLEDGTAGTRDGD